MVMFIAKSIVFQNVTREEIFKYIRKQSSIWFDDLFLPDYKWEINVGDSLRDVTIVPHAISLKLDPLTMSLYLQQTRLITLKFALVTHAYIDTQQGLRDLPTCLFDQMRNIIIDKIFINALLFFRQMSNSTMRIVVSNDYTYSWLKRVALHEDFRLYFRWLIQLVNDNVQGIGYTVMSRIAQDMVQCHGWAYPFVVLDTYDDGEYVFLYDTELIRDYPSDQPLQKMLVALRKTNSGLVLIDCSKKDIEERAKRISLYNALQA